MTNRPSPTRSAFSVYRRLLALMWPYAFIFILAILGNMLHAGVDAGFTYFLRPMMDKGFIARDMTFIRSIPWMVMGLFLLRGVGGYVASTAMVWVGRSVMLQLRGKLFDHFLHMPARSYDTASGGSLLSMLVYNVEQVASACTDALTTLAQSGFMVAGLLWVMFHNSWRLSLIYVLIFPLIAFVIKMSSGRMRRLSLHTQEAMGDISRIAEETIEGYQEVRTFGGQAYEREKFTEALQIHRQRELKIVSTNSLGALCVQMLAALALSYIIYLATMPDSVFTLTAGAFISLNMAMLALLKPMKDLSSVNTPIQRGLAAAQSIFSLLDEEVERDRGQIVLKRAEGHIAFEEVFFAYHKEGTPVLSSIDFSVRAKERLALVGRSGSGKTTLIKLLMRFYDIGPGSIKIDGCDVREITLASLRAQFSTVSQQVVLFNDTIAKNIAYGCHDKVEFDAIREAARQAHALNFIERLPQGFNTVIGDNGVLLSGGERQRIAIARALLKDAPILILDEATSSLDSEAEYHIQEALARLMERRTTLVIAHRLSTIERADNIVVLDRGRMVEVGTHGTLLNQNGLYAKLHAHQFKDL